MRREAGHITREGEFFRRTDAELLEHMRDRAERERQRRRITEELTRRSAELGQQRAMIAEAIRVDHPQILQALQKLGYNPSTASLLFLVPLVHMAWIDGSVTRAEQDLVLSIAHLHGVERYTPADNQLNEWLHRRPTETFLQGSLCAVRAVMQALATEDRRDRTRSLIDECRDVASVSGGILHKVCAAERSLLKYLEHELEPQPEGAVKAAETSH
jgi:hypothetical protein